MSSTRLPRLDISHVTGQSCRDACGAGFFASASTSSTMVRIQGAGGVASGRRTLCTHSWRSTHHFAQVPDPTWFSTKARITQSGELYPANESRIEHGHSDCRRLDQTRADQAVQRPPVTSLAHRGRSADGSQYHIRAPFRRDPCGRFGAFAEHCECARRHTLGESLLSTGGPTSADHSDSACASTARILQAMTLTQGNLQEGSE